MLGEINGFGVVLGDCISMIFRSILGGMVLVWRWRVADREWESGGEEGEKKKNRRLQL